ncbi:MAG: IS200/IS605 family transposase [Deltaproteobacteria bacterium]|nr:IS200/IS605 family transposase [Deltaproteobacteria bacterium]
MNTTSYLQLYLHLVWATWDRLPLVTSGIEEMLYPMLAAKATELGCRTVAIGGIEDHVHQLIWLPATVPIARIARELKGASAHSINRRGHRELEFKWQAGYGAFTLAKHDVERVAAYVRNQRAHHKSQRLSASLESIHDNQEGIG